VDKSIYCEIELHKTKTKCLTLSCLMSTGQHNVPIHSERLAVYPIMLCGLENFVGIVKSWEFSAKVDVIFFFILEHFHYKNFSVQIHDSVCIQGRSCRLGIGFQSMRMQDKGSAAVRSFWQAQCNECINCHFGGRCNVVSFLIHVIKSTW
jgi:hypothetical protein